MIRRGTLPVLGLLASGFLIACGGGDGGGTGVPVASQMQKTAGDTQTGAPGTQLPVAMEVKVTDDEGRAVPDFTVSFSTTAGSVNPQAMDTDNGGRARTTLTLPDAEATVTVTASGPGVPSVTFTAQSVPEQLSFVTPALPAGRTTVTYGYAIQGVGGAGDHTFTITAGTLPTGLVLESDGTFSGAPTQTGAFPITVELSDEDGETVSRAFTLNTCAAPADLAVGEVRVLDPSALGQCGVWLPNDANGRYYRVGIVRTNETGAAGGEREVTTTVSANGVTSAAVADGTSPFLAAPSAFGRPVDLPHAARLRELATKREATARHHERMFREAETLRRRLGPSAVARSIPRAPGVAPVDLPAKMTFDVTNLCQTGEQVTALKIAEDDRIAVFQDSTQNAAAATKVLASHATALIDYVRDYGQEVIDAYFDGVDDIDGNGKVIVFVTPEVAGNVQGYVWPGDLYDQSACAGSNEAELIYMNVEEILALLDPESSNIGLALATLVHEMKHVSSVYERLEGDKDIHPLWLEEGGAEIASVAAARSAWEDVGGPGYTATLVEDHWRAAGSGAVTSENLAVFLDLYRVQEALATHPNSIISNTGNSDDLYGTGWLFLQWLGDAYGGGGTARFADADLFADLNDRSAPTGIDGVEAVTGSSWTTLLQEFVAAAMYNGTPEAGPKPLVRYDMISAWELFCVALDPYLFDQQPADSNCKVNGGEPGPAGAFPWPVTVNTSGSQQFKLLTSGVYRGDAGQGGFRVHDFRTNGTGIGAEINLDVQAPAKVVVVRVQ